MAINMEEAINSAISNLTTKSDIVSEAEIDNYVFNKLNKVRLIFDEEPATDQELKIILAAIKSRLSYTITRTDSVITDKDFESWFFKNKINYEMNYWNRYKVYLEKEKHFSKKVIDTTDDVLDQLTDLIGNPEVDHAYQRRGLIIGDVQSGKTSNFIGLMCKASDVGYKLIVVLASTTDKLREQTQLRVDEGFIGYDSDDLLVKKFTKCGAAKYGDKDIQPVCVTTRTKDFNKNIANQMGIKLNQTNVSIVFVVKKNVSVLDNLNKWITSLNEADSNGKIDQTLLVIDDEADYASINTNSEEKDPTKTNARIHELLSMFKKASYVGFTATPYANVFIDPESKEKMQDAPLFPKDYIYCLDAPSNYIGARNIFGDVIDPSVKTIEFDVEKEDSIYNILPLKHKKDADFDQIPDSLKAAVQEFFVANAIRDLRGATTSHRSMLINISRFTNVHGKIKRTVESYVNSLKRSVAFYSKKGDGSWQHDYNMMCLYNIYKNDFAKTCENEEFANTYGYNLTSWESVMAVLHEAVAPIVVRVVNQKSKDEMNYEKAKGEGLRVITIGGIALSRGLTLEGLMTSYFFRSTNTYDTLMQMGRWFGYREGYKDLCRIWMTDDAQECYIKINQATEELRDSIIQYKNSGLIPLDFGIKVRADNNMLITARNKMRTAKTELVECSLSSKVVETAYIGTNKQRILENYKYTVEFLQKLSSKYTFDSEKILSSAVGYHDVTSKEVLDYVKELNISIANIEFDNDALANFIEQNDDTLSFWDVALIQGHGSVYEDVVQGYPIKIVNRKVDLKPNTSLLRISGKGCRVGGPSDGRFGLTKDQMSTVKSAKGKKLSQVDYFRIVRKPQLAIYLIEPEVDQEQNDVRLKETTNICNYLRDNNIPLVAVGLCIPALGNEHYVVYAMNKIEQALKARRMDDWGEAEDEDDQ